jgi:predicted dehydrogenase
MAKKSTSRPLGVGIIGCGNISAAYFKNIQPFSDYIKIVACADLNVELAQAKAAEHGVARGCSVAELLEDEAVDIVLNLTIPQAHAAVNRQALKAGKHAYTEKPFSLGYKEGSAVLKEAEKRKLRLGCAPDTVLGGGIQTCRKLIDDGAIGKPIAATANMLCHGHESWHPNPDFYYQAGGGPLFDMGPYYLTSLVTMLGPRRPPASRNG